MSDLKMSDVWPSAFDGVGFTYAEYVSAKLVDGTFIGATSDAPMYGLLFGNKEPADAMMHAINSHDKLTSDLAESQAEVERLREALSKSLKIGEYFCSEGDLDDLDSATSELHELLGKDGE